MITRNSDWGTASILLKEGIREKNKRQNDYLKKWEPVVYHYTSLPLQVLLYDIDA